MTEQLDTRREEVLVTADWLARNLERPGLRIVDMRKGDAYQASHIPGAVPHGGSPFLREEGDVIGADSFAAMMSRLGVDEHTLVIAYDDGNGLFAARLWWVAKYYGHAQVKVLDGGWDLWLAKGRLVSAAVAGVAATSFTARPQADWVASTDQVQAALGDPARVLLDVRGIDEWTRTRAGEDAVVGHIPGATHLVWSSVLDAATKCYLPGADLRRLFEAAGATPDREVIPYCQGGIRAAHSMLALHLAGFDRIRNYEGSWAAWSRSGLPIEPYAVSAPGTGRCRRRSRRRQTIQHRQITMQQLTVFAGRHLALGHLVCRRLEAALDGRLGVTLHRSGPIVAAPEFEVLRELGVECVDTTPRDGAVDYLIVLDAAEPPTPGAGRVIDWTLLSASFSQAATSEAELRTRFLAVEDPLGARIDVLRALVDLPDGPPGAEFHGSIRVQDLARSVRFYAWLLNTWPREWTHRYATFVRPDFALTFVLLVADGKTLHHDTLYHLGIGVADRAAVIDAYHRALAAGVTVGKPPRTTWRGTPLHELWLADPDGTLIEIYARLTPAELTAMPADQAPEYLVAGTAP